MSHFLCFILKWADCTCLENNTAFVNHPANDTYERYLEVAPKLCRSVPCLVNQADCVFPPPKKCFSWKYSVNKCLKHVQDHLLVRRKGVNSGKQSECSPFCGLFEYLCVWATVKVLHRGSLTRPAVVSDDSCAAGLKSCQQEQAAREPHKHTWMYWRCTWTTQVWNRTPERLLSHSSLPLSSPLLSSQLNETAKQLMEIDKPIPANAPGPSSEPAPLGPCSSGPSPSASPSNGNGFGHRRGEGKKNAKKRHSFTALSVSQRAAQLNNRHSMEISHPVLISSSDPRAAARIQVHANAVMYTDPIITERSRSFISGKISLFEHKKILD